MAAGAGFDGMYVYEAEPSLWNRGAVTCRTCGSVWVERGKRDRNGCSGYTFHALNGHFSCCKCAKKGGWAFFDESGCEYCHRRSQDEKDTVAPGERARSAQRNEPTSEEQKHPALLLARKMASTQAGKFEIFEGVQARIADAQKAAAREFRNRHKTADSGDGAGRAKLTDRSRQHRRHTHRSPD